MKQFGAVRVTGIDVERPDLRPHLDLLAHDPDPGRAVLQDPPQGSLG